MFDVIGEAAVQQKPRMGAHSAEGEKEVIAQKAENLREARPVEQPEGGSQADLESGPSDEHSRNRVEDGKIVVEKYDENGKLVKRTPPGYLPFGEVA